MGPPVRAADHDPVTVDEHVLERGVKVGKRSPEFCDRPAVLAGPDDPHVEGVVADELRGEEGLGLADIALVPDLLEEATCSGPQFVIGHSRLPAPEGGGARPLVPASRRSAPTVGKGLARTAGASMFRPRETLVSPPARLAVGARRHQAAIRRTSL